MGIFNGTDKNDLDKFVEHLEPEDKRAEFEMAYKRFAGAMEQLMLGNITTENTNELRWLSYIRAVVKHVINVKMDDNPVYYTRLLEKLVKISDETKQSWADRKKQLEEFINSVGAATRNNELLFNWRCIMAPSHILDYIIVHEMCH